MDFDTQQQILADQLRRYQGQAQTQAPQGRMVGRTFVAPNPLEYLAAGLKGYGGMKGEQQTQQEIGELAKRRQEQLAQALQGFGREMQGSPATPYQEGAPDVPGAQDGMPATVAQPARAGNPMGAYQQLLSSGIPELQKMGMQGVATTAQAQQEMAARQAEAQRRAQDAEDQKVRERDRIMAIMNDPNLTPQQKMVMGIPEKALDPNFGKKELAFVDGQPVDKYTGLPVGAAIPQRADPNKPFNPDGTPNLAYQKYSMDKSKAGAAKTDVRVNLPDKKFYEGLGSSVSGKIEKDFGQAESAVQTLNNANQIAQGLEKALIGPLANQRVALAQVGQALGVTGKDTAEVLQNTRNVIQGLARQELSAAGQMKGQGQITESERAILRKAESGNISDFTKPELQTFLSAIRKTARSRVATHQRNVQLLGEDPEAQKILPYLQIQAPEDYGSTPQPAGAAMPKGFRVVP